MNDAAAAVRMQGIAKRFGPVQALRGADFTLAAGEVHALLGENGAGKSTLMHILYGLTAPDAGAITVRGVPLPPRSPRAAMTAGIGMVHQHFSLVPRMTVAENVWLGRTGLRYQRAAAVAAVSRVGEATGLALDPDVLAGDLPAGLRQRLEIVKALARDVRVLILDEPTAALTPREVDDLFAALRRLVVTGTAVVLITHKLREVMAIADRVTVLRHGEVVLTGTARQTDADALARAMIGESEPTREVLAAAQGDELLGAAAPARHGEVVLEVRGLTVRSPFGRPAPVQDVSLEVRGHEIVGVAAVEGNGQRELMRAIAGVMAHGGTVGVGGSGVVGFVPEDRQHEGLILDFTIADNLALGGESSFWMDRRDLEHAAAAAIEEYAIRASGSAQPVRTLSGGNQQKVVLARELGRRPALLVAENPTRGLDVRATAEVRARLRRAAREDGLGVLFYSTDLDEVLAVADRVGVMVGGRWRWVGEEDRSRERVGALMLGAGA